MFFVIPIPTGKRYTSKVSGNGKKDVVCEKCGKTFSYTFPVEASGTYSSRLVHDSDAAKKEAEKKALENFNGAVKDAVLAVACPSCGHYQSNMIEPFRKSKYRSLEFSRKKFLYTWFFGFLISAALGTALKEAAASNGLVQTISSFLLLYVFWFPLIPLGLRIFVFVARRRIDPNSQSDRTASA